jgi:O-antigen/teichoic acid export membrane protein
VLTFGDRFFLQPSRGLAAVGIYSFAYQFGFLMYSAAITPFSQAWTPRRYELVTEPRPLRDRLYRSGLMNLTLLGVTGCVGIALFVHPMLRIMSKADYLPAADLVPIILVAYLVQGWWTEVQFGINVSEQTRYLTYAVWISVAVVLVLYATLIPVFGAYGAAIATLVAFVVRFGLTYRFSQRLWVVDYDWKRPLALVALGLITVIPSYFLRLDGLYAEVGTMCALFAAYSAVVWTKIMDVDERRAISVVAADRAGRIVKVLRSR